MTDTAITIELVEREDARGTIAGSDYGSRVRVIARSPTHVMFNALGCQLWNRDERGGWHSLKKVFQGQPTIAQYEKVRGHIDEVFGAGVADAVITAWRTHKTVLVNGGGEAMPLPNRMRAIISQAKYDEIKPDWKAPPSAEAKRCAQCDKPLRIDTDHHRMGFDIQPNHPRTVEDCQKLTNRQVVAVHGYGVQHKAHLGLIERFETWDGESYQDQDFCSNTCAALYGRRAVQAGLILPAGEQPETAVYRPREDVEYFKREEQFIMFQGKPIRI